jgi:predicted phosphodiesterase
MFEKVRVIFNNIFTDVNGRRAPRVLLTVFLVLLTSFSTYFAVRADQFIKTENSDLLVRDGNAGINGSVAIGDQPIVDSDGAASGGGSSSSKSSRSNTSAGASSSSSSGDVDADADDGGGSQPETLSAYVAYYADSQSDTDGEDQNHQRAVDYILATSANPVFHAGDLLEDGTEASRDRFNAVTATLRATRSFYAAQGNNERNSSVYFDNFVFPGNEHYYSVNRGNLHMIILDNYATSVAVGSAQYNWLLSDLTSEASQSRITAVIFHYPIYGAGGDSKGMIGSMVPLFRQYGVDYVISGHEHAYQKAYVDGIYYFVMSGQPNLGYATAKVYSSYVQFNDYNSSNLLVDSVTINNR